MDNPSAGSSMIQYFTSHSTGEDTGIAEMNLPAGFYQYFPFVIAQITQQEHLNPSARLLSLGVQPGRKHLCIVENQHVTLVDEVRQMIKVVILDGFGCTIQNHEAATIPVGNRGLCDQSLRDIQAEVG
jgi:hypothetical protein